MSNFVRITQYNLGKAVPPIVLVNLDQIESIIPGTNELDEYPLDAGVVTLITTGGRTIVTTAGEIAQRVPDPLSQLLVSMINKG